MSSINTNGINVNYPVPGVNNNSQGFRDNFASIKTNLDTASTEITDLQNKAVVKQALTGSVLNNDMANTLISNASTRSFRATMYNLGGDLSGIVSVNASLGDVQYGTVNANTTLQFGFWPPAGTQSNIEVQFTIGNSNAYITFPSEAIFSGDTGVATIENGVSSGGNLVINAPANVTQLNFQISTVDCGNTLYVTPINRPRQATQIQQRTPAPTGFKGDEAGAVAVDETYLYVCTDSYNSIANVITIANATATGNTLTVSNTGSLTLNDPIIFTGANVTQANLVVGTIYYVKSIPTSGVNGTISVSATRTSGTAGANVPLTTTANGFSATTYNGTDIWKRIALTSW